MRKLSRNSKSRLVLFVLAAMDCASDRTPLAVLPIGSFDELVRLSVGLKLGKDISFDLGVSKICEHVLFLTIVPPRSGLAVKGVKLLVGGIVIAV